LFLNTSLKIVPTHIFDTLCHEFHHARRYDGPGYGKTLFDGMIFEGLAMAFEEEVSGKKASSPAEFSARKNTQALINKTKGQFNRKKYSLDKWFYKDPSHELPEMAGYEMGYFIVKRYLSFANKKASELVLEDSDIFLEWINDTRGGNKVIKRTA
jgi:uncharacterized protein YjaZ